MRELFPIPRSLTGDGVRETLAVLGREIPLEVVETPSGTQVFDWDGPPRVESPRRLDRGAGRHARRRRRPTRRSTCSATASRSTPSSASTSSATTSSRIADDPELIPYRTSYWKEQWGFCMSRRQLESLEDGDYHVVIDATLEDGSLTSGEVNLPGASDAEFLLTTHVCHPALANDNLSGVVLLWALAKTLAEQTLTHTFRLLWSPGTLGPLCWLDRNRDDARPHPARARRLLRRRSGAAALQAKPARRRADRPRIRIRARRASRRASSPTGSRPAATSGSSARPDSTSPSARCRERPTASSPSTTPRRTT